MLLSFSRALTARAHWTNPGSAAHGSTGSGGAMADDKLTQARALLGLALDLLPLHVLASLLTDEAAKRANELADTAEILKFGESGKR